MESSSAPKNCSSSSTTAVPGGGPPASGARTGWPLSVPVRGVPTKRKYAAAPPSRRPSRSVRTYLIQAPLASRRGGRRRRRGGRRLRVDEGHQRLQPLRERLDAL